MNRMTGLPGEGRAFKVHRLHPIPNGQGDGGEGGVDLPTDDGSGPDRPVIRILAGEIERVVDEAEAALAGSGRGLYQRGGQIVCVGEVKITTSGGNADVAQRILERKDNALVEDLTAAAVFQRYETRTKEWCTLDAPMKIAKTLRERESRLRLPVLTGIVNAPTLRPDGSLLAQPGYDQATGLLFDPRATRFPRIPDRPSREDGAVALRGIEGLFATMPFVEPSDRAVAVSAVLTACTRNAYPTAPMHAITAPTAGSGKSMIIDTATMIATGRRAAVLALGKTPEETEKRLNGALLSGDPVLALDNCEAGIGGDLLCQMLTQSAVRVRALGGSTMTDLPTNIFVTATGNNLVILGDMTRRTVLCRINAGMERPELRVFEGPDPVAVARDRRGDLVVAALTAMRAYVVAGRPPQRPPLGSFEDWSRTVRDALLWLGCADPVGSMEEGRRSDPKLAQLTVILAQWRRVIGPDRVTAHQVIEAAIRKRPYPESSEFQNPEFRDALLAVAGNHGSIDGRRLGTWLSHNKDRPVNGLSIAKGKLIDGIGTWQLADASPGP